MSQGHSPSLAVPGSAMLWTRGRDGAGCFQPGCAVVQGAEFASLYSGPLLCPGLEECCRIPNVGADHLHQILTSPREGSCLGILHQSCTSFSGLSEESPAKIR